MDGIEVIHAMNKIAAEAKKRMDSAAHVPGIQYAEILWMTAQELSDFFELRMALPCFGEEASKARARIQLKIQARSRS